MIPGTQFYPIFSGSERRVDHANGDARSGLQGSQAGNMASAAIRRWARSSGESNQTSGVALGAVNLNWYGVPLRAGRTASLVR